MSDFHGGAGEFSLTGRNAADAKARSDDAVDHGRRGGEFHRFGGGQKTNVFSGVNPRSAELLSSLSVAIGRNAIRMTDPKKNGLIAWENANIPAGYTYLLQIIGHDLVQTSTPSPSFGADGAGSRNMRRTGLDLETVFGGGPSVCPFAFSPEDNGGARLKLKTGGFAQRNEAGQRVVGDDDGDLARAHECDDDTGAALGARDVFVADPRNEDNAVIAQLTALFHRMNNRLVDAIRRRPDMLSAGSSEDRATDAYVGDLARGVLSYCYRNMIRHDLLPRLLDERVHGLYEKAIEENGVDGLLDQPPEGASLPIEFAFAASRIGHFMVRPAYNFGSAADEPDRDESFSLGQVIRASSRRRWKEAPFDESWRIDWLRFFPVDETTIVNPVINWSARIRPHMTNDLKDSDLFPTIKEPGGRSYGGALLFRDLLRNADAGVTSTEEFCQHLKKVADAKGAKALHDLIPTPEDINEILTAGLKNAKIDFDDLPLDCDVTIESVTGKAPLLLFLLCEADFHHKGRRLGPVGSVLFADVIYRALSRDVDCVGPRDAAWNTHCGEATHVLMGDPPKRMIDLIHRISGLGRPV